MSYTPNTDFLALLRQTAGGARVADMPGLDFVVAALSRAGLFTLSVGQTAPTTSVQTTAWLKPAIPTWSAEGTVFLYNAATAQYESASYALWTAFLAPGIAGYSFQNVALPTANVVSGTSLLAIQRVNPAATALTLPPLAQQFATTRKLQIVDFSTSIAAHAITLTTPDGATIMQRAALHLQSTPDNLAGVMLTPSPDLNSWIIAP